MIGARFVGPFNLILLGAACTQDVSVGNTSFEATANGSASTGATGDGTGTTTSASADASATGSGGTPSGSGPPKLDLAVPDAGDGPPPGMPTCDALEDVGSTSVGCEFWAIDVPTIAGQPSGGLGIGVGNPWRLDVTVVFEDMRGPGGTLREIGQVVLGPLQSTIVEVNGSGGLLANEDHTVAAGLNANAAFRVTSDQPISAMQIKPVGGATSVVPDASMLLPTNALDKSHFALGYGGMHPDFVIATATQDGTTLTTQDGDVVLDAFDAFRWDVLQSTGFLVGADAPIAVFSGSPCVWVPNSMPWCDHVEEQVFPLSAWGTRYVGARHPQRMAAQNPAPEDVVWKVVAATDDTTVTLTPAVAGPQVQLAQAGDFVEFATPESFLAESAPDKPFMLVQYMTGGTSVVIECLGEGTPVGDPYMMQMVPIEQWLTTLPFFTDTSYVRDFVFIAREAGGVVNLACFGPIPDDRFVAIAGTGYEVGWIDLDAPGGGEANCGDGQQVILADAPVGVYVGGVDCAASYGYPGGLSLDALWVPPDVPPG